MASTVRYDWYEGHVFERIASKKALDMIPDSEPIAIRKVLTTNSTFFATLFDGGFAGKDSKMVTLPEEVFEDFEVIDGGFAEKDSKTVTLRKLVSEDFEVIDGAFAEKDSKTMTLPEVLSEDFDHVAPPWRGSHKEEVRLWNLGDMLGCPMFQDVALTFLARYMSAYGGKSFGIPPYLLASIWDACAPGSKLRKLAIDQCVIDARMDGFGAVTKEQIIQFAEEHEDFARAYVAASITNGHRERRDLLEDLGDYSSIAKSNKEYLPGFGSYCFFGG